MGRPKPSLDENDIAKLLALKGEVVQTREDTAEMRGELDDLRKDVHAMNLKQDTMAKAMSGLQEVVSALNTQLSTMADILKSFSNNRAPSSGQPVTTQTMTDVDIPQTSREAAEPDHTRPLTEELRKRLALEQEKTKQCALQLPASLPPV